MIKMPKGLSLFKCNCNQVPLVKSSTRLSQPTQKRHKYVIAENSRGYVIKVVSYFLKIQVYYRRVDHSLTNYPRNEL